MSDEKLPARVEPTSAIAPAVAPAMDATQRWRLIRDLAVFQVKLVIDGLKDLVLAPLSLFAGAVDLARATPPEHSLFRALLRTGARFDRWVGLFESADRASPHEHLPLPTDVAAEPKLDNHLIRLEQLLVTQQQRGGLTAEAKRAVDHALDLLEAASRPARSAGGVTPQRSDPDDAAR